MGGFEQAEWSPCTLALADFPNWARNIITINHFLVIVNSSINFLIYCGDVVFR